MMLLAAAMVWVPSLLFERLGWGIVEGVRPAEKQLLALQGA